MALKLNDCRKKVKNVNFRSVPPCKYEYNDPNEKFHWRKLINDIEKLAKQKTKKPKNKCMNLWAVLPPKLHARVSKYVKVPPDSEEEGDEKFKHLDNIAEPKEIMKVQAQEPLKETTLSEILDAERSFRVIKIKADKKPTKRTKTVREFNWEAEYVRKKLKNRIQWKSKLYKLERDILEKPLFEQAEEIMDQAAGSFADWVNSLGATEDGNLTKDMIKQLFSIELGEGASAASHIAPKEVKAVPHEVALRWDLPEMSLEMQVKKHFNEMQTKRNKKPRTVAFGRTLPISMREWVPSAVYQQLQPDFPDELLTKETLFKGISHLRSTKLLVEHYLQHENLQRPQYLIDAGSFKPQIQEEYIEHTPLYERIRKSKK